MATGTETLTRALRELGVLYADQALDATLEGQSLPVLIDFLDQLPDLLTGPVLHNVDASNGLLVGGNVRLRASQSGAATVTLPANPSDGWRVEVVDVGGGAITLARNGNKIVGSAANYAPPSNTARLFFRADTADWVSYTITAAANTVPYPVAFDDIIAAGLVLRLASHYDQQIRQEVALRWVEGRALMEQRYAPRRRTPGERRFGDGASPKGA